MKKSPNFTKESIKVMLVMIKIKLNLSLFDQVSTGHDKVKHKVVFLCLTFCDCVFVWQVVVGFYFCKN